MSRVNTYLAMIAYLLGPLGFLYVFLFHRENRFASYHAKQSMGLTLIGVMALATWIFVSWLISWIPYGFILAIASFAFVIAFLIAVLISWVTGMIDALQARTKSLPILNLHRVYRRGNFTIRHK